MALQQLPANIQTMESLDPWLALIRHNVFHDLVAFEMLRYKDEAVRCSVATRRLKFKWKDEFAAHLLDCLSQFFKDKGLSFLGRFTRQLQSQLVGSVLSEKRIYMRLDSGIRIPALMRL